MITGGRLTNWRQVAPVCLAVSGLFWSNSVWAADFSPTGGVDASAQAAASFTASELTKLSTNDDKRIQSNAAWPDQGSYDNNRYLEFVFSPSLPEGAGLDQVLVTHKYRRSGTLTAAKLVVMAGASVLGEWAVTTVGALNQDVVDTFDISHQVASPSQSNNLRVRFLAYRSTSSGQTKTSHDLVGLSIGYGAVTPSPTTQAPAATASAIPAATPSPIPSPVLTRLVLTANPAELMVGEVSAITVSGLDQFGELVKNSQARIELSAEGGALNAETVTLESGKQVIHLTGLAPGQAKVIATSGLVFPGQVVINFVEQTAPTAVALSNQSEPSETPDGTPAPTQTSLPTQTSRSTLRTSKTSASSTWLPLYPDIFSDTSQLALVGQANYASKRKRNTLLTIATVITMWIVNTRRFDS